jgi:hypothetical protein
VEGVLFLYWLMQRRVLYDDRGYLPQGGLENPAFGVASNGCLSRSEGGVPGVSPTEVLSSAGVTGVTVDLVVVEA